MTSENVLLWSAEMVGQWITENNLPHPEYFIQNEITGDLLVELNYATLHEMGITSIPERARIRQAVKKLIQTTQLSISSTNSLAESWAIKDSIGM
jgi:hypothetical protein